MSVLTAMSYDERHADLQMLPTLSVVDQGIECLRCSVYLLNLSHCKLLARGQSGGEAWLDTFSVLNDTLSLPRNPGFTDQTRALTASEKQAGIASMLN